MKSEQTLEKDRRILSSGDFSRLWQEGKHYHSAHFVVIANPGRNFSRLGLTISRKVGNSVCRNRIKRWIRDTFRKNYKHFGFVVDLSVIAKRQTGRLSRLQVDQELLTIFARLETDDHV